MRRSSLIAAVLALAAVAVPCAWGGQKPAPPLPRATLSELWVEPAHLEGERGGSFTIVFKAHRGGNLPIRWQVVLDTRELSGPPSRLEVEPWTGEAWDGEYVQVPCYVGAGGWGTVTIEVHVLNEKDDWRTFRSVQLVLDLPSNFRVEP